MGHNPLAENATTDGYIFKFDTRDEGERQNIAANFRTELWEATEGLMGEADFNRRFRVRVFNMSRDRSARAVMKLEVYGILAPYVHKMRPSWLKWADEVHAKAYIVWHETDGLSQLRRFMVDAEGGQQPTPFGRKTKGDADKGDGRGLRVGSRKSDFHAVFYQRTGQLTGCEVRLQDNAVKRISAQVLETVLLLDLPDQATWLLFFSRCAMEGERRLRRDFELKGASIGQYVNGWSKEKYRRSLSFAGGWPFTLENEEARRAEDTE